MKKIIDGRKYDTETANLICSWDNGACVGDFSYTYKSLYVKKNGEYFFHEEGGANTQHARLCGDSYRSGSNIRPITYKEAVEFAQKVMTVEKFEATFGEVSEDSNVVALNLMVSPEAYLKLADVAKKTGKTTANIIENLIKALDKYD